MGKESTKLLRTMIWGAPLKLPIARFLLRISSRLFFRIWLSRFLRSSREWLFSFFLVNCLTLTRPLLLLWISPLDRCRPVLCVLFCCLNAPGRCVCCCCCSIKSTQLDYLFSLGISFFLNIILIIDRLYISFIFLIVSFSTEFNFIEECERNRDNNYKLAKGLWLTRKDDNNLREGAWVLILVRSIFFIHAWAWDF